MTKSSDLLWPRIRTNLHALVIKLFELLESGTPFEDDWHIHTMAHYLDMCARGECKRLIIAIGPRYLKSFCASVTLPIWILGHDPTAKIICVSYSDDLALHFSWLRRQAFESPLIKKLFPGLRINAKKNNKHEVVTTKGGYILTTSIGGSLTGRGGDYIIIDDPIKTDAAMSDVERNTVNTWYKHTAYSRLNNKNTGRIIVVAQRVHHDDLIGNLLDNDGDDWLEVKIPAIETEDTFYPIGGDQRYFRKEGEVLQPSRESFEALMNTKHSKGSFVFEAQLQQSPVPPGGVLIHREWFGRYKEIPKPSNFRLVVDSWDTAAGISSNSAYSACTTWAVRDYEFFLLDCRRYRLEFPDLLRTIVATAKDHNVHAVLIENASSGTQILQTLKKSNLPAIGITPKGDKESRAIEVSPIIESGKLWIPEDATWLAEFESEVARFPHSKFTDQVDSMTQFLKWAQHQTARDLVSKVTIINYGGVDEIIHKDKYFDRMGAGVFDNLFK
jgi:predicted phage terminase large subunit-like protein